MSMGYDYRVLNFNVKGRFLFVDRKNCIHAGIQVLWLKSCITQTNFVDS
jgi:hypothetical protein